MRPKIKHHLNAVIRRNQVSVKHSQETYSFLERSSTFSNSSSIMSNVFDKCYLFYGLHHGLVEHVTYWKKTDASLEDEPFYHGYMTREEAERCLTKDGEFMVRKAVVKGNEGYIISVQSCSKKLHLHIQEMRQKNLYWLDTYCFESIPDLIRYHQDMRIPVYKDDVILKSCVEREQWQLYHEQVVLGDALGSGEFGLVYKGTLTVGLFTKPIDVAVKTLKTNTLNSDQRVTFLREANVMLKLQHKNVVRLYGVATQKEPIMIVMELAAGDDSSIAKEGTLSLSTKRKYCFHVVCGMKYLEKQQVMHRDLAARNCLIDATDTCKISDFGLSLLGRLHKEKNMVKVPVRWLAPETLRTGTYSNKSDVWSYGVLMFEVFSNGKVPYEHVKLGILRNEVLGGLRLQPSSDMPSEDRAIMTMCFENDPAKRSSFADLEEACVIFLSSEKIYCVRLLHLMGFGFYRV
ncbi:unnamed protein product [Angiostrongylus costaricensis]|uniref:Tyrosine-protein kinase n=1 Tax=Angiostrongylus costaricensis TaxID=334426 RepID=A0A158PE66_ANGCS|nr:unnamed protein product [Angiostrongylus costaricensis]